MRLFLRRRSPRCGPGARGSSLLATALGVDIHQCAHVDKGPGAHSPSPSTYNPVKVIATIGPASVQPAVLEGLLRAGVNVCRLNMSHGTHAYHRDCIHAVRAAARAVGVADTLAVALDTKGPEIRTAPNHGGAPIHYTSGMRVRIRPAGGEACANTLEDLFITYPPAVRDCRVGGLVLVADGQLALRIDAVAGDALLATVEGGGAGLTLRGRNNVHLPGVAVDMEALSGQDRADLLFGAQEGVDLVFASFARHRQHMLDIAGCLRAAQDQCGAAAAGHIPVIAKIENEEGLCNVDAILDAADGVMVARGDLGVELPIEALFLAQKAIAARALVAAKPVICATQMLESMTDHNRPTRAEAGDVANAVIDGCDAVMLSGETAAGQFPVEAAAVMGRIARRADAFCATLARLRDVLDVTTSLEGRSTDLGAIASAAALASFERRASLIVTTTVSGNSVRQLAKFRPACPIIAVCQTRATARALALTRGVAPIVADVDPAQWQAAFPALVDMGIRHGLALLPPAAPSDAKTPRIVIVTNTDTSPTNPHRCSLTIRVA